MFNPYSTNVEKMVSS